jgi:AhpD family alkylhydroperoxidase
MSLNNEPVQVPVRLDMDALAAPFNKGLAALDASAKQVLDAAGIDDPLRELIRIRASQLNGCTYCVDMHTTDALAGGESPRRLAALPVWRESGAFTARERAAIAFTETVTLAASTRVPDQDFAAARAQFSPEELAAILCLVVAINAWNTIGVAARPWPIDYRASQD